MPKYFTCEGYRATLVAGANASWEFDLPRDAYITNIFVYVVSCFHPTYFSMYASSLASATIANMIHRQISAASPWLVNVTSAMLVQQGRMTVYILNSSAGLDEMIRFVITCVELEQNTTSISRSYPGRSVDQFSR